MSGARYDLFLLFCVGAEFLDGPINGLILNAVEKASSGFIVAGKQ
jgi:hypothetical protein